MPEAGGERRERQRAAPLEGQREPACEVFTNGVSRRAAGSRLGRRVACGGGRGAGARERTPVESFGYRTFVYISAGRSFIYASAVYLYTFLAFIYTSAGRSFIYASDAFYMPSSGSLAGLPDVRS